VKPVASIRQRECGELNFILEEDHEKEKIEVDEPRVLGVDDLNSI